MPAPPSPRVRGVVGALLRPAGPAGSRGADAPVYARRRTGPSGAPKGCARAGPVDTLQQQFGRPRLPRDRQQEVDPQVCLAIPGRVVEVVDEVNRLAKVDVAGVRRNVNIGLFEGDDAIEPGDWVLIHVGFAISKIDEDEARATRELLEAMGAEYEQELAELRESVIE